MKNPTVILQLDRDDLRDILRELLAEYQPGKRSAELWQKQIFPKQGSVFLILHNGIGLGEVAEPKSQIEKLNLIIKNEC